MEVPIEETAVGLQIPLELEEDVTKKGKAHIHVVKVSRVLYES